jgi:glycine/D-amino acid oxidase-like deaminating enzyme
MPHGGKGMTVSTLPHVVVAGGDSGHGFKHAAGIGKLLAQIVAGERPYCATGFLDPARFPDTVPLHGGLTAPCRWHSAAAESPRMPRASSSCRVDGL